VQEYFSRHLRSSHSEKSLSEQLPTIPIDLVVRLDERAIGYGDLRDLKVGDVWPLPADFRDHVGVYAGKDKLFRGEPRFQGDRYACLLREITTESVAKTLAENARADRS
jgi:flagellar motor switch protein FliM